MLAATEEHRTGPRHHLVALLDDGVNDFDAPALPLYRGLDSDGLHEGGTQQIDRQAGGLQLRITTGLFDRPAEQAADDVAADGGTPGSLRHRPGHQAVAVDGEERFRCVLDAHPVTIGERVAQRLPGGVIAVRMTSKSCSSIWNSPNRKR